MKHEEFLSHMKSTVEGWRESTNHDSLKIQYLGFLTTVEYFRDQSIFYDSARNSMHELLIEFSKGALRALLLINTGGIFVIMTILSSMISKESIFSRMIPVVASESWHFVVGVSFAVVTILLSYFAQWLYNNVTQKMPGLLVNIIAMIAGLISFACFVRGALALMNTMCSPELMEILKKSQ